MNALKTTTLDSTDRLVCPTAQEANFNARMADVFHVFGDVIRKMTVMIIVMKVQIAQKENVGQVRIFKKIFEKLLPDFCTQILITFLLIFISAQFT